MSFRIDSGVDLSDEAFFEQHEDRQHRVRLTGDGSAYIAVRRRGAFCLRVHLGPHLPRGVDPGSETDCERLWWSATYPDADPRLRRAAMVRARRNGGAP